MFYVIYEYKKIHEKSFNSNLSLVNFVNSKINVPGFKIIAAYEGEKLNLKVNKIVSLEEDSTKEIKPEAKAKVESGLLKTVSDSTINPNIVNMEDGEEDDDEEDGDGEIQDLRHLADDSVRISKSSITKKLKLS